MQDFIVTPWTVKGNIDYDVLIEKFGTERIDENLLKRIKKHTGELHHFLRRRIFFSHRDLNFILYEYEKGNKFFLYTGRAPSGKVHLGHLIPWIFTKWLQDKFDVDLFFQFPDEEKFLFKDNLSFDDTQKSLHDNMLDVIAMDFNPEKTYFLIDTQHANLMYKEACKISKKITLSTVKATFGFTDENNIGEIFYTSMQAVPAILPSILKGKKIPCLIPCAIDQDPHFRVARDVLPKLNFYKPSVIHSVFLPGLQGMEKGGKMSSSEEQTCIYTTDDEKTVKKKINKYSFSGGGATIEEQRKYGANVDVDVSYKWLTFFEEDDRKVFEIYEKYKNGEMLTGELKAILIEKLNKFLKEHQRRRENAEKLMEKFIYMKK